MGNPYIAMSNETVRKNEGRRQFLIGAISRWWMNQFNLNPICRFQHSIFYRMACEILKSKGMGGLWIDPPKILDMDFCDFGDTRSRLFLEISECSFRKIETVRQDPFSGVWSSYLRKEIAEIRYSKIHNFSTARDFPKNTFCHRFRRFWQHRTIEIDELLANAYSTDGLLAKVKKRRTPNRDISVQMDSMDI